MFEVDDGTVADGGKNIVVLVGSTHRFQHISIFRVVASGSHQGRHGSTGTRAISDDSLCVTKHLLVEVAQITNGGFQVEDSLGRTAGIDGLPLLYPLMRLSVCFVGNNRRAASASTRNHHHITFFQGAASGITRLWLCCRRGHIATDVCTQEDGCLLRGSIGHIDVEVLVCRVLHIRHIEQPFVGHVTDFRAIINGHRLFHTCVKLQCRLCHRPQR